MLVAILLIAVAAFILAYVFYGRFLAKRYELDDSHLTPSHISYDGIDRVPAHKAVLLGHHFSSIAGAAPIVGPIIAGLAFGWLPVVLWIVLGTIFIGGVIDFSALTASIRHNARSIAEIARQYMSPLAYRLLLAFIWLTLVYVLTVFADLTATTFTDDGGVASSSLMYIALAILFGLALYKMKISLLRASIIFLYSDLGRPENAAVREYDSDNCRRRSQEDLGACPDHLLFYRFNHPRVAPFTAA
jgi:carbon starvation protein